MERVLTIYYDQITLWNNQIILGIILTLFIFSIFSVHFFTSKLSDKTLIGVSKIEIELMDGVLSDDKFYLNVICYTTWCTLVLLMSLIYMVGHMGYGLIK